MKKIELNPDNIQEIFIKNLSNNNVNFVFSTDIVMNSWIDWIVTHAEISGTDAVCFERFLAWDEFKRQFLTANQENLTTIPTLLRKLFISDLIEKNAKKTESERLQVIINPKDSIASTAESFTDWICKNIPSLHFWKKRIEKYSDEYGNLDDEDKDYLFIYEEYSKFLKANNLFEPTWVENIEISEKNKEYIIFYPEQFLDFPDFEDILKKAENVTLCVLPKNLPSPKVTLFPDSRKELRTVMLQIIDLVQSKKADWSEISLSIPDIDTYRPYIEREFNLYNIPFVIKAGVPLTKNCAGRIFQEFYDCYSNNFTFDTVRTLLLDEYVPWKDELQQLREDLIREGNRMRCICSPYEKDIWLGAFTSKINRLEKQGNNEETVFYNNLKDFYYKLNHSIKNFFAFSDEYSSFEHILRSWMEFKQTFLKDNKDFSEEANNILSRCIKELEQIIQIEQNFSSCNLKIKSPFQFFLQILNEKTYTPQTTKTGVQIFKYKVSAAAYFKYQFVIDSSQKNLEVSYKRLIFLNTTKRSKLHLLEDDKNLNATEVYLKLYAKQTEVADNSFVHYSAATETFAGYSIPHSLLISDENFPNLDEKDYVLQEKNFILGTGNNLHLLTPGQKNMFQNWIDSGICKEESYSYGKKLKSIISRKISDDNKLRISARGDLENFYPCPRKWIFKSILKFHDDTLDTNLMQNYDMGNLNHKILELFISNFNKKVLPVYDKYHDIFLEEVKKTGELTGEKQDCTQKIYDLLNDTIDSAVYTIQDFRDSPLVIQTLKDQKHQIFTVILNFLKTLLQPFESGHLGGCTVIGQEEKFIIGRESFNFEGRIDALYETPDKDLIVVDYKNSNNSIPNKKDMKMNDDGIITDFQMPLYYKLVSESTKNDIYSLVYYAIKKNEKHTAMDPSSKNMTLDDYIPTLNRIEEYAQDFTQTVTSGDFLPRQSKNKKDIKNVKNYEVCTKCPFKTVCRTTYSVAEKEIDSLEGR